MLKNPVLLAEIGIDPADMAAAVAAGRTINTASLYPWLDQRIVASARAVVVDGYPRLVSALDHFNSLAATLGEHGRVIALHLDCPPAMGAVRVIARDRLDDRAVGVERRNDEFDQVQWPLFDQLHPVVERVTVDATAAPIEVLAEAERRLGLRPPD
jgi:adenylate kinase family enzyme